MTDGVVLVDKPAGKTSHDIVAALRRQWSSRTGHAGTLDPFATGLLLVLLGRATRCQRFLMGLDKAYEVVAALGAVSDTGDTEGAVTRTGRIPPAGAPLPTGRIRQRPPAYSAVKVAGRRAYALARAGREVELPEREVVVHEFVETWREGARAGYRIRCSSGTYVRSLIAELGDAYCLALRRTAIGPFRVEDADPERPLSLQEALGRIMPVVALDEEDARAAGHGRAIPARDTAFRPPVVASDDDTAFRPPVVASDDLRATSQVLLADEQGPIAVAEPRDGMLKPVVGFRAS